MPSPPSRVIPLLVLAAVALASPATPEGPPVLASKALRVELTGTAEALWRFVPRSGAPAQAFAAPVFPLDDRRVTAALGSVARVGDPVVLPNGVFEHTFRGPLRDDPSLALPLDPRTAFLPKPFTPQALADAIHALLSGTAASPRMV